MLLSHPALLLLIAISVKPFSCFPRFILPHIQTVLRSHRQRPCTSADASLQTAHSVMQIFRFSLCFFNTDTAFFPAHFTCTHSLFAENTSFAPFIRFIGNFCKPHHMQSLCCFRYRFFQSQPVSPGCDPSNAITTQLQVLHFAPLFTVKKVHGWIQSLRKKVSMLINFFTFYRCISSAYESILARCTI